MDFSIVKKVTLGLAITASLGACMSTGPALKSSNSESVAGIEARVPYANYTNYYGYVDKKQNHKVSIKAKMHTTFMRGYLQPLTKLACLWFLLPQTSQLKATLLTNYIQSLMKATQISFLTLTLY